MKKLICIISLSLPMITHAFSWEDLWLTKNQQAQKLMEKHQFSEASKRFEDNNWRATAAYRAGHYKDAASGYQSLETDDGYFNQGNALAHQGQYEAALKAYSQTLRITPNHEDAQYNQKIIEKLLKKDKQKQKKQNQNQNQDKQNQDKQNQDKQNQDKQNQNKQNQDKQNQDKQNQDKQNQDKQNQDKQNQDKQNQDKQNQDKQNAKMTSAEKEKQRAKEQWLKLIPDDPGGLMREKFLRDHLRRQNGWGS